jgi:hypothetical protein
MQIELVQTQKVEFDDKTVVYMALQDVVVFEVRVASVQNNNLEGHS